MNQMCETTGGTCGRTVRTRYHWKYNTMLLRKPFSGVSKNLRAMIHSSIILAKESGTKLEELQAYTTLRGSQAEDTKCVLIKIGAEDGGVLMIKCVTAAVGMLGAGFFQDYTGGKKQKPKLKIYDHNAVIAKDGNAAVEFVGIHQLSL